jgi:uncharacterized DUF497 family protein
MIFDYDVQKSRSNKTKHGIDFEEASLAWDDENIVVLHSPYLGESRLLALGRIYNKIWTVVFTPRNGKIRIISARHARDEEAAYYEKHKTG